MLDDIIIIVLFKKNYFFYFHIRSVTYQIINIYKMADSKYANLPGIDTSSKDVYESGDLPEEDQGWKPEELKC